MTKKELETIGKVMAREYYDLCKKKGIPDTTDFISSEEACKIAGKSKAWLYKHNYEIPHNGRFYSKQLLIEYLNR